MNAIGASIIHPTDFSDDSIDAFAHVLKIVTLAKGGFMWPTLPIEPAPLDSLRGSMTERVLRHASCPVLASPTPLPCSSPT